MHACLVLPGLGMFGLNLVTYPLCDKQGNLGLGKVVYVRFCARSVKARIFLQRLTPTYFFGGPLLFGGERQKGKKRMENCLGQHV